MVILSISASSSTLSAQSIALTFCSTCSTRVAPAITLETCGREASHENASSSMVWPRAWAKPCNFSTISSLRGDVTIAQRRRLRKAGVVRRGGAAFVFAGQQTARERKERQQPEFIFLRRRQQILFDVSHDEAVFVLARHERIDVHL